MVPSRAQELHLGVEADFRPAKKAHPAFRVADLGALKQRAIEAGLTPKDDEPLPGYDRFYLSDPFGNRLEFHRAGSLKLGQLEVAEEFGEDLLRLADLLDGLGSVEIDGIADDDDADHAEAVVRFALVAVDAWHGEGHGQVLA